MSKKNWLQEYGNKPQKFQVGGVTPAATPAPEAGAGGPGQQLDAMLAEFAQTQDPQLAVAICNMLLELIASQGGGDAAAGMPAGAPPMARRGTKMSGVPVFKK